MKKKGLNKKAAVISVLVTLCALAANQVMGKPMIFSTGFHRLGFPLIRLIGFIFIGLLAGQLIESLGWTRQVAVIARPFFRFSNLGNRCSAAFTAAFISGAAANAMLLDYYQEKHISKIQLFLSNYINQFPAFFLHLPTTVFIVLPLTGRAGAWYLTLTFLATLLRTCLFMMFGHFYLPAFSDETQKAETGQKKNKRNLSEIYQTIKSRLPSRILNIAVWVLPIYTIVFLLNQNGFFDYLNQTLSHSISTAIIPVQSLSVVILSFAAEFTSGFAAAGALMSAGVLSVKQTVIALLLGNILAFPIRALRHQLPRYMGIFSPKMGLQLLLSGQFFRISSLILVGIIYYMVA